MSGAKDTLNDKLLKWLGVFTICFAVIYLVVFLIIKLAAMTYEGPEEDPDVSFYKETISQLKKENRLLNKDIEDILDDYEKRVSLIKTTYKNKLKACREGTSEDTL